jgi:hypothetical protein
VARQSREDRLKRFEMHGCPVHGTGMDQIDGWYYTENGQAYTIVGCSRYDCAIKAREFRDGFLELSEEFLSLFDESLPDPPYLRVVAKKSSSRSRPCISRKPVWAKTNGRCFYCGIFLGDLSTMTIDHVSAAAKPDHSLENLVPACRSCNCSKGPKTLEEFRFFRRMQVFGQLAGVSFSIEQVNYLKHIGVELEIPVHRFWFEETRGDEAHSPTAGAGC